MENPHKKKNWNEKYLSSMKYTSFERRNYYISTLDGEETYIIGYNLDNIIEGKELPRFEGCTETIISLAIYQLAIITSSKKILDTKQCYFCGNIFIPTRKSRCYCKTCSRQKAYKDKPK